MHRLTSALRRAQLASRERGQWRLGPGRRPLKPYTLVAAWSELPARRIKRAPAHQRKHFLRVAEPVVWLVSQIAQTKAAVVAGAAAPEYRCPTHSTPLPTTPIASDTLPPPHLDFHMQPRPNAQAGPPFRHPTDGPAALETESILTHDHAMEACEKTEIP